MQQTQEKKISETKRKPLKVSICYLFPLIASQGLLHEAETKQRHPSTNERLAVAMAVAVAVAAAAAAGCVQYLCTLPDPLGEQSSASFIIKWP